VHVAAPTVEKVVAEGEEAAAAVEGEEGAAEGEGEGESKEDGEGS